MSSNPLVVMHCAEPGCRTKLGEVRAGPAAGTIELEITDRHRVLIVGEGNATRKEVRRYALSIEELRTSGFGLMCRRHGERWLDGEAIRSAVLESVSRSGSTVDLSAPVDGAIPNMPRWSTRRSS